MSLEIEVGTTLEEIFLSLSDFGANPCIDNGIVSGNFKASNTYFVFRECDGVNEIATEDAGADWYVGTRGAMHCPVESLAASSDDVRQFLIFYPKQNLAGSFYLFNMKAHMQLGMRVGSVSLKR